MVTPKGNIKGRLSIIAAHKVADIMYSLRQLHWACVVSMTDDEIFIHYGHNTRQFTIDSLLSKHLDGFLWDLEGEKRARYGYGATFKTKKVFTT